MCATRPGAAGGFRDRHVRGVGGGFEVRIGITQIKVWGEGRAWRDTHACSFRETGGGQLRTTLKKCTRHKGRQRPTIYLVVHCWI